MAEAEAHEDDDGMLAVAHRALLQAGQVAGAILALLGLGGVFIEFMIVIDGWSALLGLAQSLPQWVVAALEWIGGAWHYVVVAYQNFMHPKVQWLASLVSLRLEPWHIDVLFILSFSALSGARGMFVPRAYRKGEKRSRIRWFLLAINWPFGLMIDLGLHIARLLDGIFGLITRGAFQPVRMIYMWLPYRVDTFFLGFIANVLVLGAAFGVNWAYELYRGAQPLSG